MTVLQRLKLDSFRCFAAADLELGSGCNFFVGPNASGKSSLLEAVYLLSRGRSFRRARKKQLIARDQDATTIFANVDCKGRHRRFGLSFDLERQQRRLDGNDVRLLEHARLLPATVFEPASYALLESEPKLRRQWFDWTVFHVEPEFLDHWQRYRRALQQRNLALKSPRFGAPDAWDDALAVHGEKIHHARRQVVDGLRGEISVYLRALGWSTSVELALRAGFDENRSLRDCLDGARENDRRMKTTTVGPHRFDLIVCDGLGEMRKHVSRGQQKLIALALMLSQAKWLKLRGGVSPILLFDDLSAELDSERLAAVLRLIGDLDAQALVTMLTKPRATLLPEDAVLFHVERDHRLVAD